MWPDRVVVNAPLLDQDSSFAQGVKQLAIEELIAESGIEALAVSVLPGAARFDVEGLHTQAAKPGAQGLRDELSSVIGSGVLRRPMLKEQLTERVEHVAGVELALHPDRQAFARELVDHTQHAEHLSVMGAVLDEVIGPDMSLVGRPEPHTGAVRQPEPTAFGLFHWNLKPFTAPDAIDPLCAHRPAIGLEHLGDPAIAIPSEPLGQGDDRLGEDVLIGPWRARFALGGTVLADHTAGPALGDAKRFHHTVDRVAAARRAQYFPFTTSCRI